MKPKSYLFLCMIVVMSSACHKDKVPSVTYRNLAPFDATGKPNNLIKDSIPPAILLFAKENFPDHQNFVSAHPDVFSNPKSADITITQLSDVYVTFVSGNASSSNALGFYTYPTNNPPDTSTDIKVFTYIFPNTGGYTPLVPGDKVKIGTFDAGTTIGFVFAEGAWQTNSHTINNNVPKFFSTDSLNPEVDPKLKKHVAVLTYMPDNIDLIGFEDTNRASPTCDQDFNDAVIYCTVVAK